MTQKIPVRQEASCNKTVGKVRSQSIFTPDKVYPKVVKGIFENVRTTAVIVVIAVYFAAPWLTWDGRQAILFDLPARKFYVFWYTFWPQDFFLLSMFAISAAFGLFLITTYAGRVWCGYACPQTIWSKIFVWIEALVEGSRNQRIKLTNSKWNINKIQKRFLKHFLWILVGFFTALGFLAYFTPVQLLIDQLQNFDLNTWQTFWLIFFTAATYINAGWMREQVCLHGCPYARFQSIMFDSDTLIVSYDATRGEDRGPRKRNIDYKAEGLGDCIDCMQCVHVCPTGIDIRNGLQYECITCASCVDACDQVMEKMGYDKGLIRYTTENALHQQPTQGLIRPRIVIVSILLGVVGIALLSSLIIRSPIDLSVTKDRSSLYRNTSMGMVENNYILKILNKSQRADVFNVKVSSINTLHYRGPEEVRIEAGEIRTIPVSLEANPDQLTIVNQSVNFKVASKTNHDVSIQEESRFIGPIWVEQK